MGVSSLCHDTRKVVLESVESPKVVIQNQNQAELPAIQAEHAAQPSSGFREAC